ncbi:Trafficking protein particle complex subunit 4 [Perkinsus olseni]|uniref:Trafficking protein particle complex subunit 4 n=1 Tax=Perkinsus olseni TaxID=32597 RepID=A0A7J6L3L4_PEROL|nr:Trafficking protein particle complex subunit 4 [Perkinsus olseni]
MFFASSPNLVRSMFLPYFSKKTGAPRLRLQLMGKKGRRFYRMVACNQKDPRNGKHMEVLGSFAPKVKSGVKEIRLRFSRSKFWLGVGASMSPQVEHILALSNLIPPPPPAYGRRTKGHYELLEQVMEERQKAHQAAIEVILDILSVQYSAEAPDRPFGHLYLIIARSSYIFGTGASSGNNSDVGISNSIEKRDEEDSQQAFWKYFSPLIITP